MPKSHKQSFLDNIDGIYENDSLWLAFRTALGMVETRLWDERIFRRLEREKQRLCEAIKSGAVVLPKELYAEMAAQLKQERKANSSHVKSGKSSCCRDENIDE